MRAQTVPWGRPQGPLASPPPSPWAGRVLGLALLALALVAVLHGSGGRAVWQGLKAYLGGRVQPVTAPSVPAATGPAAAVYGTGTAADAMARAAADTQAAVAQVQRGEWSLASQELRDLGHMWLTLSGDLASQGVPVLDINDFTAALSDAQAEVGLRDASAARAAMGRLASEMNVLALDWVSTQSPTFVELKDLAVDLSKGVHRRSWSQVSSDSQALLDLVDQIEQGY